MNSGFHLNVIFSVVVVNVLELSSHPRNYFHHYSGACLLEHGHSSWMWYTLQAVCINGQKTIPTLQLSILYRRTLRNYKEDIYWFWTGPQLVPSLLWRMTVLGYWKTLGSFGQYIQVGIKFDAPKLISEPWNIFIKISNCVLYFPNSRYLFLNLPP